MFKKILIGIFSLFSVMTFADESPALPQLLSIEGKNLSLNGEGTREKFFFDLYEAGLYLPQAGQEDADSILNSDEIIAIRLIITSTLISAEKMQNATREGFEKSTHGQTKPLEDQINAFINAFSDEIVEDDVFDLSYLPGTGVEVVKNGEHKATIEAGPDFRKALFGIWLSDDPVQDSLKQGLLGL